MSDSTQGIRDIRSSELAELRERLARSEGKRYWRSLDELADNPEFLQYLHREFPEQASELVDPVSRRRFLQLMGASIALAGATACTGRSTEKIIPYVRQPENLVPGKPLYYASAVTRGGYGAGVLVESHMGRPTKIEGNPEHPASLGATDAQTQAEVLTLYDPDRSEVVLRNGRISTWEAFLATLRTQLATMEASSSAGLRILTGTVTSPTLADQVGRMLERFPGAEWVQYEPTARFEAYRGAVRAFGEPLEVHYDLSAADVVLTLDADVFAQAPGHVRYVKDFSARRRVRGRDAEMPRLYSVESATGITGVMADHRWRLKASQVEPFARALAAVLGVSGVGRQALDDFLTLDTGVRRDWIEALAADLEGSAGSCLVVPGDEQPARVHALAHALNDRLGNVGATVLATEPVVASAGDQIAELRRLVDDLNAGDVELLMILGGNPVYDAPADLDFVDAMQNAAFRVHLGLYEDETAAYCHWHVPQAHFLESWGDVRAFDGTASIVQPLIEPLHGARSACELLSVLAGETGDGLEIVRAYWQRRFDEGSVERTDSTFEHFWRRALHDGVVRGTGATVRRPALRDGWDEGETAQVEGLEVVFRPDPSIGDGRYNNNGWLQETPRPLTKLTWDNAVQLSPATAVSLGVGNEQVVEVTLGGRTISGPVWIVPGQADDTVVLNMGYGRRRTGRVGKGAGFDVFPLRTSAAPWIAAGARVEPTGSRVRLATTQHHHSMEGRDLARMGTLQEFRDTGTVPHERTHTPPPEESLYEPYEYPGHAWAMTIDLGVCTGCNGCMTACQAENNVPVVGKGQVLNGREMHWIRIDRYYAGGIDEPEAVFQPVPCMQCENAPCEVVCPVAATVHGAEGLNQMIYNRCVGTRYCANNCPYKVRRFNFLEYTNYEDTPVLKMLQNPDVTVRSRGVMEKCTYCVQRINTARQQAKVDGREMRDGDVVPACAQACPADAIVFGDMNDPDSEISRVRAQPLHYSLLAELGTRPRTNYLARLRNPNPAIADRIAEVHDGD